MAPREVSADHSNTAAGRLGMLTMIAGAAFIIGALGSIAVDPAWVLIIVGFALLAYVVPRLHAYQAPADGWTGTWGARLVLFGAALVVILGMIFLVLELVTDPGEPAWADVLWMVGFVSFAIGIVLFGIGSAIAKRFPPAAPILMLLGLVAAIAIDMATGAFFEDTAATTEWGFFTGVPLFGLGLAWMGYTLWKSHGHVLTPRSRHHGGGLSMPGV
jgi:hypothetical protein